MNSLGKGDQIRDLKNPYIAGRALSDGRSFFGREDILQAIEDELASPDRGSIVLFGQRRIGKSSILHQLQRTLDPDRFLPIYLDLMDRANRPLEEVLYALATAAALALARPVPALERFDDRGEFFQNSILPQLYQYAGSRRPCFILDEFDVLDQTQEENLSERAATRTFFPYLRRLMETEPRLGFVFVIGRKAEDLSINLNGLFKATRTKKVSALNQDDANKLIRSAERNGTLEFDHEAVTRIFSLTSGHPFFTQLYCQRLWDRSRPRGHGNTDSPPRIDVAAVDALLPQILEEADQVFLWIWNGLPAAERVILSVLAQAVETKGALTLDDLSECLQENGVPILIRELEIAPRTLAEIDLLQEQKGKYRFLVELLRLWILTRQPIERVREKLDKINPLADSLYQGSVGFRRQGDAAASLELCRRALLVNPNHSQARLLLAELLVEQNQIEDALKELEHVAMISPNMARFPMIMALKLQAENLERDGKMEAAIENYEKILDLNPREISARQRRSELLTHLGDQVLNALSARMDKQEFREDFIHALTRARSLFAGAENCDKVQAVEVAIKAFWIDRAEQQFAFLESLAEAEQVNENVVRLLEANGKSTLEAFAKAGAMDRHKKTTDFLKEASSSLHLRWAAQLEAVGDWKAALVCYRKCLVTGSKRHQINQRIQNAERQLHLANLYNSALGDLKGERLDAAIGGFVKIVNIAPMYRDSAVQLVRAIEIRKGTEKRDQGKNTDLILPVVLATLLGGLVLAGIYQVAHWAYQAATHLSDWLRIP